MKLISAMEGEYNMDPKDWAKNPDGTFIFIGLTEVIDQWPLTDEEKWATGVIAGSDIQIFDGMR